MINRVVSGHRGARVGLHICRGNWSRDEDVLLSGDYAPLVEMFRATQVDQLVLEFATPRAGELGIVGEASQGKEIGLGVINPRTATAEPVHEIVARAEQALRYFPAEKIFLNPDCGFGCFSNRCVNDERTAVAKIRQIVAAATLLRDRHA